MNLLRSLYIFSAYIATVLCVMASPAHTQPRELWHKPTDGGSDVVTQLLVTLVEVARSTTYSNLLALNITNVIILGLATLAFLSYFGFIDMSLGRSVDGPWGVDVSAGTRVVASLTPLVHQAFLVYKELQTV
nr:uncharacterized protein LOC128690095 [Cherax quadricarinatus]